MKHPHFDLTLPSDELLFTCVGARVMSRKVCHEWPLSCVERVVFEGEIQKYCKTTRPPSMEIEAYAALTSPMLVPHVVVSQTGPCSTILLDAFLGQRLSREFVEGVSFGPFVEYLRSQLAAISGKRPVFVDFSTLDNVHRHLTEMVERLHRRFGKGMTPGIDPTLLQLVEECIYSQSVGEAFIQDAVYSNGDLSADNVLVYGHDVRVIDWQFPRVASLNVELVNLYTSVGIDPRSRLSRAEVAAGLLCKVRWLAECADEWLTNCSYYDEITGLITQVEELGTMA